MVESRDPENMGLTVQLHGQLSDLRQAAASFSWTFFLVLSMGVKEGRMGRAHPLLLPDQASQ